MDDLTSEFLLPFHFVKHVVVTLEKFGHFRSLVVAFSRRKDAHLRVPCQIFAHFRNWKNDLFHRTISSHNLTIIELIN